MVANSRRTLKTQTPWVGVNGVWKIFPVSRVEPIIRRNGSGWLRKAKESEHCCRKMTILYKAEWRSSLNSWLPLCILKHKCDDNRVPFLHLRRPTILCLWFSALKGNKWWRNCYTDKKVGWCLLKAFICNALYKYYNVHGDALCLFINKCNQS